ncbi:hypothetical protein XA3_16530 [Xylocopilactobacillus apicola]|uniref:Uncharacterized protein n=2 Tax=Xylocopilactobacillus apicola TaxID=2932184 RepID=A0AAU9CYW3_9LACO|nr:hypothetical protein XA3_16530 [Xylocopilactobacillus apicola]
MSGYLKTFIDHLQINNDLTNRDLYMIVQGSDSDQTLAINSVYGTMNRVAIRFNMNFIGIGQTTEQINQLHNKMIGSAPSIPATPSEPTVPTTPTNPTTPSEPNTPSNPTTPSVPSTPSTPDSWTITDKKGVGTINYQPGYGVNVWNAPGGTFTGQRLQHNTSWKVFQMATNAEGKFFYSVGKDQWVDGQYFSFGVGNGMEELDGIVTIKYIPGYGVNLWKGPNATSGCYESRSLKDGSEWKTFGKQNGFYKIGENQWVQGDYVIYRDK